MQIPRREQSCHGKISARLVRSEHICLGSASLGIRGRQGLAPPASHVDINGTRAKG